MPADDLVINVRQIENYTPVDVALPSDALLLQRGGLGGPYYSIDAQGLVSTALMEGLAPLQIGVTAPADALGEQIFTTGLVTPLLGYWAWNAYAAGPNDFRYLSTGAAGLVYLTSGGWYFDWAPGGAPDTPPAWVHQLTISPTGYLAVNDQIAVTRDPILPMEVATSQWVLSLRAVSVTSFMGRYGDIALMTSDIVFAGGAPLFSPWFEGCPRAPTPAPGDYSSLIATTAFVQSAIISALNGFLTTQPLVFSFNGRSGPVVLTAADVVAADPPYAPLDSPNLTGAPTAPTPLIGSANAQIATTAFVMNAVSDSTAGVASFNGRTGLVTLQAADVSGVGGALLASPAFTGTPTAPTQAAADNSTRIATTAFVQSAASGAYAPINSPAFTGTPTAPTAALGTATTQIATTAFVQNQIAGVDAGVVTFNGRAGNVNLIANDISAAGGALLAGPAFTGIPTAPTANAGTNTLQLATTAFVNAAIATATGAYLPLSGGTLTGNLTMTGAAGLVINGTGGVVVAQGASFGSNIALNGGAGLVVQGTGAIIAGLGGIQSSGNLVFSGGGGVVVQGTGGLTTSGGGGLSVSGSGTVTGPLLVNSGRITSQGTTPSLAVVQSGVGVGMWLDPTPNWIFGQTNASGVPQASVWAFFTTVNGDFYVNTAAFKPGGGSWADSSDARIKTTQGAYDKGLDAILQLEPHRFVYRGNDTQSAPEARSTSPYARSAHYLAAKAGKVFTGLVADAVEPIFPECVTRTTGYIDGQKVNDLKQVDTSPLLYALINAVKELAARLAALETKAA